MSKMAELQQRIQEAQVTIQEGQLQLQLRSLECDKLRIELQLEVAKLVEREQRAKAERAECELEIARFTLEHVRRQQKIIDMPKIGGGTG